MGKYEDLEKIHKLKEQGIITEKEFENEKKKILGNPIKNFENVIVEIVKKEKVDTENKTKKDSKQQKSNQGKKHKSIIKKILLITIPVLLIAISIAVLVIHSVNQQKYYENQKDAIRKFSEAMMYMSEMGNYEKYLDKKGIVAYSKVKGDASKFNKNYRSADPNSQNIMYFLLGLAYENEHGDLDYMQLMKIDDAQPIKGNWNISQRKATFKIRENNETQIVEFVFTFYKDKIIDISFDIDGEQGSLFREM